MLEQIESYLTSWRFPAFMLTTMFVSWILIMIMAFVPVTDSAWGAFAEDFKVWCFGYDTETGKLQWIYLFMFTINPFILAVVILFVWAEPLGEVYNNPRIAIIQAGVAFFSVMILSLSFLLMYEVPGEEQFEFRPETLRVALTPPEFELINQKNEPVSLADFRGKVVILTSVYASCADTCPMILDQAKKALENLNPQERDDVVLMAVTMQPEKDTPELLNRIAGFYRLDQYNAHLLTGETGYVNAVLDKMNVSRFKRKDSADIDHVNLFLVIDRNGAIAYRFSLGDTQLDWMTQALRLLVNEKEPEIITEAVK